MADYITKIRTVGGVLPIDYNALANKPTAESLGAAPVDHNHDDRYLNVDYDNKYSKLDHEHDNKYSDLNHTHTASEVGAIPKTLTSNEYGIELPTSGHTKGQIFFIAAGSAPSNFVPAIESTTYPGCYYRNVEGSAEWINPPMIIGTEYRTAERWNGKAVYTQLYALKDKTSGNHVIDHGITSIDTAVSIRLTNNYVEDITLYSGITNLTFGKEKISLNCTNAFGYLIAELRYTKQ